jgi:hypothetical protein
MNRVINKKDYKQVCEEYFKVKSSEVLARSYNVHSSTICNILKRCGIKPNFQHPIIYDFYRDLFKNGVDSKEKSYILGIFYADGCNSKKESIILSLQEDDKYILEKIAKIFNKTGALVVQKRKKQNHKLRYRLELHSKELSNDLKKLGMVNKKSLILRFPNKLTVSEQFLSHFIRGYFDGDGCASFKKGRNSLEISITSSPFFCKDFQEFLSKTLNIYSGLRSYKFTKAQTVKFCKNDSCIKFYNYIYKDCGDLYLTRKKEKFDKFIKNL